MHPVYGVGTLVSRETLRKDGVARDYYVVELAGGGGCLRTPVEKAGQLGLRRTVSGEDRDRLWKLFAGRPRKLAEDPRKRRANIAGRLREGDFVEVGRVVRDLESRCSKGRLSAGDRRLLKRAKELLAEELAAADGVGKEEAMARIGVALERRFRRGERKGD